MKRIEGRCSISPPKFYQCISPGNFPGFCDHQKAMKTVAKHSESPHATGCHTASPLSFTMVSETFAVKLKLGLY